MSLESILNRILNEARREEARIIEGARKEKEKTIKEAKEGASQFYKLSVEKERAFHEAQKQRIIINAYLEGRKNLLKAKQELIDTIFEKIKPILPKTKLKKEEVRHNKIEEVSADADDYIARLRYDYETEIAKILFG